MPLIDVLQNLARTIRTGGTPGPTQRVVIEAMTPAQQRAAGIFLAPDGTVQAFRKVLTAAVTNAAVGKLLTTNQQAALGLAFNGIPSSGARRDAINALAGSARGEVRDNISAAVGQSMRAAADIRREARRQTEAQTLKTAGVKRPSEAIARLAAAGITHQAADKILRLKAAGVTRPVSQVERLAAQGVRNPVQRLLAQADRRDKAAATAAGTSVNKLRALRAAGVQQPAQKVAQLKAAGVRRPVQKLAQLKQAGVKRAAQKLVQLERAGVKRPAQKIATLRQAGIRRGAQKVAQLKAAGVKRPAAKLTQLQQAGVKRPVQQLVQLKQAGVRRPAQKLLAQAPAQRGALGKQTQEIIRTTDQSLTFKTAGGQTRTAAQVAANAAKNLAAGRPLTPNQQRLLASARWLGKAPSGVALAVDEDRLWDDTGAYNGALSGGSLLFLKSGFAFLDGGEVEHVTLIDGGSGDCRVRIYDTEDPTMLPLGALRENLATLAANVTEPSRGLGFRCRRGCYVELSGTHPQTILRLSKVARDRTKA